MSELYNEEYFAPRKLDKEVEGIQRCLLEQIRKRHSNVKVLLDVGCALGFFCRTCDFEGIETFGVDISKYAIQNAQKYTKARLYCLDVSNDILPFEDCFFDVVTLFAVLEHLPNPAHALSEAYRVLNDNGCFYAVTPNGGCIRKQSFNLRHINVHDKNYWQNKLKQAGFGEISIKACIGYGFPPFSHLRAAIGKFIIKPIFFPIHCFGYDLHIFGRKTNQG